MYEYTSIDDMMKNHDGEIETIRQFVASNVLFERQYLPCIRRYAEYVYLLPASENHHQNGEGGLFAHGLDTTVRALMSYNTKGVSIRDENQYKMKKETREEAKRWRLALFVAALAHDAGKAFSADVSVSKPVSNGKTLVRYWDAYEEPLFHFLEKEDDYNFNLKWVEGRGTSHEWDNASTLPFIANGAIRRTLGLEKLREIKRAITPMTRGDNVLIGHLTEADQGSASAKPHSTHVVTKTSASKAARPAASKANVEKTPNSLRVKSHKSPEATRPAPPDTHKPTLKAPVLSNAPSVAPLGEPYPSEHQSLPSVAPAESAVAPSVAPTAEPDRNKQADSAEVTKEGFAVALRELIADGAITINDPYRPAFIVINKQAGWINTQGMSKVLRQLNVEQSQSAKKAAIEILVENGVVVTMGDDRKVAIKSDVGGKKNILHAISKKIMRSVTNIETSYSGELKMPGKIILNVKAGTTPTEARAEPSTPSQTAIHKDEAEAKTFNLLDKLIAQAGEKRVISVARDDFGDFVKKECGEMSTLVKKQMRVLRITDLAEDVIKISIVRAKEALESARKKEGGAN